MVEILVNYHASCSTFPVSSDLFLIVRIPSGTPPPPRTSLADAPVRDPSKSKPCHIYFLYCTGVTNCECLVAFQTNLRVDNAHHGTFQSGLFEICTNAGTPHQILGYQRTLQASDLWKVDKTQEADALAAQLEDAWNCRVREARQWNENLDKGEVLPGISKRCWWMFRALPAGTGYVAKRAAIEERWRTVDARKEPSLGWSLNDVFGKFFWSGGAFKVRKVLIFAT